jgi:2-methylcitrate dehydratase PrpD
VVVAVKRIVLDCVGTALAGSSLGTGVPELLAVVEACGGKPEAAILGTSLRAPAMLAALANGGLAHALNYDDYLPGAGLHLGVTSLPAALAAAGHRGGVSGKELITSLAAGNELMARLGFAVEAGAQAGYTETRPQTSQMLGHLNAAACAGRVLRLDSAGLHSALGMAYMQASGGRQPVLEGTPAKALYAAYPSQAGMLSALLAQQGLGAECAAFEGPAGLFATYFGGYAEGELVDELGERWRLEEITFKPWPTTSVAHVFIEAAISLAVAPRDVAAVHLRGEPHIRTFCEPAATRQAPRTPVEAEDSVPFAVGVALANGAVTLSDIQPAGLRQPEALRIASTVTYEIDESLGRGGLVEVTLFDGRRISQNVDRPLGHPPRELTDEQLAAKFRDCARHAQVSVAADRALELIARLEDLDDVARLVEALSSESQ